MKRIILIMLVLLAATSMIFAGGQKAAGSAGSADSAGSAGAGAKVQIALMMRNLEEQFLKDYADNVRKLAAQYGVDLNVQDARRDAQTQLTQVETLLNQGYRYFVIIPDDGALSDQMNRMINEKGGAAAYSNTQPTASSLKIGPNFFFASSPEFVGGRIQGELIATYFDKNPGKAPGKVINMILINGQMGHPAQVNRRAGLLFELQGKGYTVNIIAEGTSPNWAPDQSNELMTAWIAAFRDKFNVVAAQNDGMALGAVQAMIQAGMVKNDTDDGTRLTVPVLGIDATGDAIASMKRNELYATVLQDAVGQSAAAFDLMYQMATKTYKVGNAAGGTPMATATIDEAPANDRAILNQCYLVPFGAVDKDSAYYKSH